MKPLAVRTYGEPILREVSFPVDRFDEELSELAQAMIDTMIAERGIGLAAPQVGEGKRVIVARQMKDVDDSGAEPLVLVNPEITAVSRETWSYDEGCLSLPGISAEVVRPSAIDISYQDLDGNRRQLSADGIFGRILLHEIDHLEGKLFIDYLSSAKKSLAKSKLKQLSQDKQLF
jgi:peptide deformylase